MQIKGIGSWVKEKLAALRGKEKDKAPQAAPAPRFRRVHPVWERNALHPTAYAIQRGRTLNPYAVAAANRWRQGRRAVLSEKVKARTASINEIHELIRLTA